MFNNETTKNLLPRMKSPCPLIHPALNYVKNLTGKNHFF